MQTELHNDSKQLNAVSMETNTVAFWNAFAVITIFSILWIRRRPKNFPPGKISHIHVGFFPAAKFAIWQHALYSHLKKTLIQPKSMMTDMTNMAIAFCQIAATLHFQVSVYIFPFELHIMLNFR